MIRTRAGLAIWLDTGRSVRSSRIWRNGVAAISKACGRRISERRIPTRTHGAMAARTAKHRVPCARAPTRSSRVCAPCVARLASTRMDSSAPVSPPAGSACPRAKDGISPRCGRAAPARPLASHLNRQLIERWQQTRATRQPGGRLMCDAEQTLPVECHTSVMAIRCHRKLDGATSGEFES